MMLMATETPAARAVELPCWPLANENDRPPAAAVISERSLAVTRASPPLSAAVLKPKSAEVSPLITLTLTEPATAIAELPPLPPPLLPWATAPAPPADSAKMREALSPRTRKVSTLVASPVALPLSVKAVSCTEARVPPSI